MAWSPRFFSSQAAARETKLTEFLGSSWIAWLKSAIARSRSRLNIRAVPRSWYDAAVLRPEPDDFVEIGDGLVIVLGGRVDRAPDAARDGVLGIQPDGLVTIGQGVLGIVALGQQDEGRMA